jgi:hypothetical protein
MFAAQSAPYTVSDPDGLIQMGLNQMGHSAKQSKLGTPMTGREVRAINLR